MIVQNYLCSKIKAARVYKHLLEFIPSIVSLHDYITFPAAWKQNDSHFEIHSEFLSVPLIFSGCGSITDNFLITGLFRATMKEEMC